MTTKEEFYNKFLPSKQILKPHVHKWQSTYNETTGNKKFTKLKNLKCKCGAELLPNNLADYLNRLEK